MKNRLIKISDIILDDMREYIKNANVTDEQEKKGKILDKIFRSVIRLGISHNEASFVISRVLLQLFFPLSIIQPFIIDNKINEIMVNSYNMIFIEENGILKKTDCQFSSTEELEEVIRKIAASVKREFNEMNPILDARVVETGARVNGVYKNIALGGPTLTIRKFASEKLTIEDMVNCGTLTNEVADFLKDVVRAGYNIFISGGTSSGKTTFLNAMASFIPKHERVIVIEDSAELDIKSVPNIISMECRNANSMGLGMVDMAGLIKSSLRMRPDRIIIGEVRGREVFQMLQALCTGHSGSMSTGHGNSVRSMLSRLESMYLMETSVPISAIAVQICEAIDIMIHLERDRYGRRRVSEICEILGYKNGEYVLNKLFERNKDGLLKTAGGTLKNLGKMHRFNLELENKNGKK